MAYPVSSSNVVLPPIRTVFPHTKFQSSPSLSDDRTSLVPLKQKQPLSHHRSNIPPRPAFPLNVPTGIQGRRASTTSVISTVPSLSFSPSPSPSPTSFSRSPQCVRLVPCSLQSADVAVAEPHLKGSSTSPSQPRAVLLVGSAIARAVKEDRKMHPYRIVRDRRSE